QDHRAGCCDRLSDLEPNTSRCRRTFGNSDTCLDAYQRFAADALIEERKIACIFALLSSWSVVQRSASPSSYPVVILRRTRMRLTSAHAQPLSPHSRGASSKSRKR